MAITLAAKIIFANDFLLNSVGPLRTSLDVRKKEVHAVGLFTLLRAAK